LLVVLVHIFAVFDQAGVFQPPRSRFRCREQRVPEIHAALPASELDALVAPIALYHDALLAQVLGAATYPARWLPRSSMSRSTVASAAPSAQLCS